jgi:ubiquinone/menaquinone biosynthesis C-methylase UbiE
MDARLQRRVQRYGWDLAADHYESLWQAQLAPAQDALLAAAALQPGERALDIACGTGLVTLAAAAAVGAAGKVIGTDISEGMVTQAQKHALSAKAGNTRFRRMDAEQLDWPDADFDVVLCALGLMYLPDAEAAVREMRRVVRPGGRIVLAIWGERARCGWASLFPIVDAEVASEVCPLFFRLGQADALARACTQAGFEQVAEQRIASTLVYASDQEACRAAFVGGPVALAWSRFDAAQRARVEARYLASIAGWKLGDGYAVPGEFVVVSACAPRSIGGGAAAEHLADHVAAESAGRQKA